MMCDTPRLNAKPRNPLHTYPSKFEGVSPPNGESTRLNAESMLAKNSPEGLNLDMESPSFSLGKIGSEACDYSDIAAEGASPNLANRSNRKSKSRNSDFTTVLKNSASKRSPKDQSELSSYSLSLTRSSKKTSKYSRHSSQSQSDDEYQPSGKTRYTGEKTRSGQRKSLSTSPNNLKLSMSRHTSRDESLLSKSVDSGMNPTVKALLLLGALAGAGAVGMKYINQGVPVWKEVKQEFRTDINSLKEVFPSQSKSTFKSISNALVPGLQQEPEHPGVVVLMYSPDARPVVSCVARNLAASLNKAFTSAKLVEKSGQVEDMMLNASHVPAGQEGHEYLQTKLTQILSSYRAAVIHDVDKLQAQPAHVLQGILDNSGAPYKNAGVVMTMESASVQDASNSGKPVGCFLDEIAENILRQKWSDLGQDKVDALVSRVTVAVAGIQAEPDNLAVC